LKPVISVEESRVLFALLDAADEDGLLAKSGVEQRWCEIKLRLVDLSCERESALMWDLLHELEQAKVLDNGWILERWRTVQMQVKRSKDSADSSSRHTPPLFAHQYRS
jgi:hypothetical protein